MERTFSDDDIAILREAVAARRVALHGEMIHTDDRAYRAALRDTLDRLERLERKLGTDETLPPRRDPYAVGPL